MLSKNQTTINKLKSMMMTTKPQKNRRVQGGISSYHNQSLSFTN
jgi:hypothetical protein